MQGQTKRWDFLQTLLHSRKKHNLEFSKLGGIVTAVAPFVIGSSNGIAVLFCKRMQELSLQNKLTYYHCIILQQNLIGKALGFKQIMADVSAVKLIRSRVLDEVKK
jgi:hypothetical protein